VIYDLIYKGRRWNPSSNNGKYTCRRPGGVPILRNSFTIMRTSRLAPERAQKERRPVGQERAAEAEGSQSH
jgi:hypothetical protein